MDVRRLARDELEYELGVRGCTNVGTTSIVELRRKLNLLIKNEELGQVVDKGVLKLDAVSEVAICAEKIEELQLLATEFIGTEESGNFQKFAAKCTHLLGRLARIQSSNEDTTETIRSLREKLMEAEVTITEASLMDPDDRLRASLNTTGSVTEAKYRKPIPVHQWNLTFSGDTSGLSINAFLERVDELRVSRNVTESQLFDSATELLRDGALVWFRSIRSTVHNWRDLVTRLRTEYEPYDYEDELWQEIRARTQGTEESVGHYIACMSNLFNRLPTLPAEQKKLKVLRKNLAPYFIHGLGLSDVSSVEELLIACKRLETNRRMAKKVQYPSGSGRPVALEPDLAYRPCNSKSFRKIDSNHVNVTETTRSADIQCWNCKGTGHRHRECRNSKNVFCYGCGASGVTRYSCVKCKRPKSGN